MNHDVMRIVSGVEKMLSSIKMYLAYFRFAFGLNFYIDGPWTIGPELESL